MSSLLLKIFICPIGIILSAWLIPGIEYSGYYQPVTVGLILAIVGVLMEYILLKKGTLWFSTLMDFAATVIIVYFISNWFTTAYVTFLGAVLVGALLAVIEYFVHLWLIKTGRTQKSPV